MVLKRLWKRIDIRGHDECWHWTGPPNTGGYGEIRIAGRSYRAHIVVYESKYGPVPAGLQLDHRCHNLDLNCPGNLCAHRLCCNPAHLEAVTPSENCKRGRNGRYLAERTHCAPLGHEYTEANTIIDKRGYRHCRECKRIEGRAYMRRKRAEAKAA